MIEEESLGRQATRLRSATKALAKPLRNPQGAVVAPSIHHIMLTLPYDDPRYDFLHDFAKKAGFALVRHTDGTAEEGFYQLTE